MPNIMTGQMERKIPSASNNTRLDISDPPDGMGLVVHTDMFLPFLNAKASGVGVIKLSIVDSIRARVKLYKSCATINICLESKLALKLYKKKTDISQPKQS